jgi:hypothetical protein
MVRYSCESGFLEYTQLSRKTSIEDCNVTWLDWFTAILCGMALLLVLVPAGAEARSGILAPPSPRGPGPRVAAIGLLSAALLVQYFRGFDMPIAGLAFHDNGDSLSVTGTVSNPDAFELKAIVIWVYERDQSGNLLSKELGVMDNPVAAHKSSTFSVKVKKAKGSSEFEVVAEGHWT